MKAALFLSAIITAATGLTENSNHMPESIPAMMTGCPSLNLPSTLSTSNDEVSNTTAGFHSVIVLAGQLPGQTVSYKGFNLIIPAGYVEGDTMLVDAKTGAIQPVTVERVFSERVDLCSSSKNAGPWSNLPVFAADAVTSTLSVLGNMKPGSKILDWGSGCGHRLHNFSNTFGVDGLGVELSKPMVEWATIHRNGGNNQTHYCAGDGSNLKWIASGMFDFAFSVGAIHLTAQDCRLVCNTEGRTCLPERETCSTTCRAVREMVRVTKPGGTIVIDHLDLSFPRSSWGACLKGNINDNDDNIYHPVRDVDFTTLPSHQLHKWNGKHWYGETFYALIISKRNKDGSKGATIDRLNTFRGGRLSQWYSPTTMSASVQNVGMPVVPSSTTTTSTTTTAAPSTTATWINDLVSLDLKVVGVDISAVDQSKTSRRVIEFSDSSQQSVLIMCHDLPGYWAHGTNDADGGCGAQISVLFNVSAAITAFVTSRNIDMSNNKMSITLKRTIQGPMASSVEIGSAWQDPGTTFSSRPVAEKITWTTGELPQSAYYEVQVRLQIALISTLLVDTVKTEPKMTTFVKKISTVRFRVVRGTTVVPAPIVPVLVVGAGLNGLNLALALGKLLARPKQDAVAPVTIVDSGEIGSFINSWHDWTVPRTEHSHFATAKPIECQTPAFNANGGEFVTCSKQELLDYLTQVTKESEAKRHVRFFSQTRVVDIKQKSEFIHVNVDGNRRGSTPFVKVRNFFEISVTGGRVFRAYTVVMATGRYSLPRILDVPGSHLPHVLSSKSLGRRDLPGLGKEIYVVGGGVSALEIAAGLLEDTLVENCSKVETVYLGYRGPTFAAKYNHPSSKLVSRLEHLIKLKKLKLHLSTDVVWINQTHVGVKHSSNSLDTVLPIQTVITAIGFTSNTSFFQDVAKIPLWNRGDGEVGGIKKGDPILWQGGEIVMNINQQWGESGIRNLFVLLNNGNVDGHNEENGNNSNTIRFEGCLGIRSNRTMSWGNEISPMVLVLANRICEIETKMRQEDVS